MSGATNADVEAKRVLITQLEESFAILCLEAPMPAALTWSEEQIYAFFESGGEDVPDVTDVLEHVVAASSSTSVRQSPPLPSQPQ